MEHVWFVGFIATFFGVVIGGGLSYFINGFKRSIGTIYAVCAGLILGLMSFGIAPEAIEMGNWIVLSIGFIVGVFLFKFFHAMLETRLHKRPDLKSGFLLTIIISFHNLPIGVILGTSDESALSTSLLTNAYLTQYPRGHGLIYVIVYCWIPVYFRYFFYLLLLRLQSQLGQSLVR